MGPPACVGQKTTCRRQFLPSIMWAQENQTQIIRLGSNNPYYHGAVQIALKQSFQMLPEVFYFETQSSLPV